MPALTHNHSVYEAANNKERKIQQKPKDDYFFKNSDGIFKTGQPLFLVITENVI